MEEINTNDYEILGVVENASKEEVEEAYKKLKGDLLVKRQKKEIKREEFLTKTAELDNSFKKIMHKFNQTDEITEEKTAIAVGTDLNLSLSNDKVEKLKKELDESVEAQNASKITAKRGRLIRKIKAEINRINKASFVSGEDKVALKKLQELLDQEIEDHKEQLTERYKNEFSDKKATVPAIFTVLPKGVALQTRRVANCISELKQAKSNKERIFGVIDLAKSLGLLAATPVIFTVKFIVQHWYLLLLLLALIPGLNHGKRQEKTDDLRQDPQPEEVTVTEDEFENSLNLSTNKELDTVTAVKPNPSDMEVTAVGKVVNHPPQNVAVKPVQNDALNTSDNNVNPTVADVTNNSLVENAKEVTVLNSTAKDCYFDLLRQALPKNLSDSYNVFDTYEDALNYCVKDMGYSMEEATNILAGQSSLSAPSIMWLVGKGGYFANSQVELLQNYTEDQLKEMVAQNQELIELSKGGDFSSILENVGATGLAAYVAYELVQLGLAPSTAGLSMLLPG